MTVTWELGEYDQENAEQLGKNVEQGITVHSLPAHKFTYLQIFFWNIASNYLRKVQLLVYVFFLLER